MYACVFVGVSQCVVCYGSVCAYGKVNRWMCDGLFVCLSVCCVSEHDVLGHFVTGNQRDNFPIKYIKLKCLYYYWLKRLDFNKEWTVLGYLGVENNNNESWVDMSWIFHVNVWSVCWLKCQMVEVSIY